MIVLVLVLTLASSASAECAWVLWDDVGPQFGTIKFARTAAYESRAECMRAAEVRARRVLGPKVEVHVAADGTWIADNGTMMMHAQCWPDNLAPRGGQR
jgi:hypothetical protein